MRQGSCFLVVIDPTAEAQPALDKAAALATQTGHSLVLLACIYDPYIAGDRFFDGPDLEKIRSGVLGEHLTSLDKLAHPLRGKGVDVTCRAVWDTPLHEAIVRQTMEFAPDIVFKDAHHHSILSRALFTNTDWHLIRDCPSALWLAKQATLDKDAIVMAAVEPTHEHDEPAALDEKIIEQAKVLTACFRSDLHLVHIFNVPTEAVVSAYATVPAAASLSSDYESHVKQVEHYHADALANLTKAGGFPADHVHLRQGYPVDLLPQLAQELNAGVVVMGAVARSRLKRVVIGSTAERTLDRFPCDVVVVKPDEFSCPIDQQSDAIGFKERTSPAEQASAN
jgi:universal stress protein E